MKCQYCNKDFYIGNFNDTVCDICAKERSRTTNTSQPIILSRVYFSEKPPTADEVCKALSDFYEVNIIHEHYEKGIDLDVYTIDAFYYRETHHDIDNKPYTRRRDVVAGDKERIALDVYLPPYLITMIGRFYEGLK